MAGLGSSTLEVKVDTTKAQQTIQQLKRELEAYERGLKPAKMIPSGLWFAFGLALGAAGVLAGVHFL